MSTPPVAKVLIVEDQRLIAADLENTLRKLGYGVVGSVSSGEEAVPAADSTRPDVVLMDIQLRGEMDGVQTAAAIRERMDVPVIYLTAYADEHTINRAKATSPFGYLVKPFNERELRASIEVALSKNETERLLRDERARRYAAEEFKHLVESIKDYAIFMIDCDGRISSWNAGAAAIQGYEADEVIGRHISLFYPPEAAGRPDQHLAEAERGGRAEDEGWRVRKDGTRFWANVVTTALRNPEGRLRGYAEVTRDVTARREMEEAHRTAKEEAERVSRLKDEFLATVSHELRTPLNVAMGEIWKLRSGMLRPELVPRSLESLERNTKIQVRLVEDLLDTSAIITGKFRIHTRPIEVGTVLQAAVDAVRPAAAAREIQLTVHPATAPERITGDRDRLQQVFWNLLSNAVKFTPRGGRVDAHLQRVGTHVEVSVTDTGIGITPQFMPRVFQRFSQADPSPTREHMGFGLGLALARHLAEAHGGELTVYSEGAGRGSTFTLRLPVPAVLEVPAMAVPADLRLDGVRVLLVDDQADARESVSSTLAMFGADVTTAGSVPEALDAAKRYRPNVLVADIAMPGENGYDLIERIRRSDEVELRSVAAAALTAYAGMEHRMRALSAGYQLHMSKPAEPAELAAAVAHLARDVDGGARGRPMPEQG